MRKLIILSLLQLVLFSGFILSQEEPNPILKDELQQKFGCEDLSARLDVFISDLESDPNSTGFIVIYGEKRKQRGNQTNESWIKGIFRNRGFPNDRFLIVRGELRDKLKIQFWMIPAGAKPPQIEAAKWNFRLPKNTKPYVFPKIDLRDQLCPYAEYMSLDNLSEYLDDNPGSRTNIVIQERNTARFKEEKARISEKLVKKYGIDIKRLRYFFVQDTNRENDDYYYPQVEVWLLP